MTATLTRDSWTGTRGVVSSRVYKDFEEEVADLKNQPERKPTTSYNGVLVAKAWDWFMREFGPDVVHEELTVRLVVELYLDS